MSSLVSSPIFFNSKGTHKATVNGRQTKSYRDWRSMLNRCYSSNLHQKHQTYIGCSVTTDWLDYQGFASWYENHDYSNLGYQLDKDVLSPNSKLYSPETCCFIPSQLNTLLIDSGAARGAYPQGVFFHKASGRLAAQLSIDSKLKHLGLFDCPNEAYQVYKEAKEAHVKKKALEWQDRIADNVFQALMIWSL